MKYSEASLDLAINKILPLNEKSKEYVPFSEKSHLHRLQTITDVAIAHFFRTEPFNQEEMICLSVIRTAYKEMVNNGYIEFGDKELAHELEYHFHGSTTSPVVAFGETDRTVQSCYQNLFSIGRPDALN